MTYTRCKNIIQRGLKPKAEMLEDLDLFKLNNRITTAQYQELVDMLEARA